MTEQSLPSPIAAAPKRRALLVGGVAAAAAATGVAFGLWKWRAGPSDDSQLAALWQMAFDTPDGGQLSMQALRGRPLLLNFWATWCPPCVEEMPLLDRFFKQSASKSWQVVGLAIDQPSAVRKFLAKTPVTFPIGMAGLGGTELAKSLGNDAGGLPFTVAVGANAAVLGRRMGRVTTGDLEAWTRAG